MTTRSQTSLARPPAVLALLIWGMLLGAGMASPAAYADAAESVAGSAADASGDKLRPRYLLKLDAKFQSADRDGDGALNAEEARSGGLTPVAEHFSQLDMDRDGRVTRREIRDAVRSRLGR